MTAEKIRRIHTVYGWATAVLCVLAGVSLILACLAIYNGGEGIFSRESVWEAFLFILAPLLLCLLALVGGFILSLVLPLPQEKRATDKRLVFNRSKMTREWLLDCVDLDRAGEEVSTAMEKEGRLRRLLTAGGALVSAVCAVPPLVYFLTFSNFPNEKLTAEVLSALYVLLPCLLLALTFLFAVSHLISLSYDRECAALRSAVKAGAVREGAVTEAERKGLAAWFARNERLLILCTRTAVFVLAVSFLILGVGNGGMNDVLQKAIRICTECIGLG